VGDVVKVNTNTVLPILEYAVPVFCPLTHDKKGQIFNTNADTIASELAKGFAKIFDVDLVFCFELSGVMDNRGKREQLIRELNEDSYKSFIEAKVIKDGMVPKIDNAFNALHSGVKNVFITHYDALQTAKGNLGTRVKLD